MKEKAKRIVNNIFNIWNSPNIKVLYNLLSNFPVLVYREKGG